MEFDYIAFILLLLYSFLFVLEAKQLIEIFYIKNKKTNYRNGIILSLTWVSIFRIFLWIKVMVPTTLPDEFMSVIFELPIWLNFVGLSLLAVFYANALYQESWGNIPWRICVIANIVFLFFYLAIGCMDSLATTSLDQKIVFGFYAAYSIIIHTCTAFSVGYYGYYFVHNQIQAYRNWILPRPIEIFSIVNWLIVVCSLSRSILVAVFAIPAVADAINPVVEYNGEHNITSLTVLFFMLFTEWIPNYSMLYLLWRTSSPHPSSMYDPLLTGHPVSPPRKRKSRRKQKNRKQKFASNRSSYRSGMTSGHSTTTSGGRGIGGIEDDAKVAAEATSIHQLLHPSTLVGSDEEANETTASSIRSYVDTDETNFSHQPAAALHTAGDNTHNTWWSWFTWWHPTPPSSYSKDNQHHPYSMIHLIDDDYEDFSDEDDPRYSYLSAHTVSFEDDAMVKIIFDENFRYRNSSADSVLAYEEEEEEAEEEEEDNGYYTNQRNGYVFPTIPADDEEEAQDDAMMLIEEGNGRGGQKEQQEEQRIQRHMRDSMIVNDSSTMHGPLISSLIHDHEQSLQKQRSTMPSSSSHSGARQTTSNTVKLGSSVSTNGENSSDGITEAMIDEKGNASWTRTGTTGGTGKPPVMSSPGSMGGGSTSSGSGRIRNRKQLHSTGSGKSTGSGGSNHSGKHKKYLHDSSSSNSNTMETVNDGGALGTNNNNNPTSNWFISALYRHTPWSAATPSNLPTSTNDLPALDSPIIDASFHEQSHDDNTPTQQHNVYNPINIHTNNQLQHSHNSHSSHSNNHNNNHSNNVVPEPSETNFLFPSLPSTSTTHPSFSSFYHHSQQYTMQEAAAGEEDENQFVFIQEQNEESSDFPTTTAAVLEEEEETILPLQPIMSGFHSTNSLSSSNSNSRKSRHSNSGSERRDRTRLHSSDSINNLRLMHLQASEVHLPVISIQEETQEQIASPLSHAQLQQQHSNSSGQGRQKYANTVGPRDILHYQMKSNQ